MRLSHLSPKNHSDFLDSGDNGAITHFSDCAQQRESIVGNAISYEKENSLYLWILGVSSEYRSEGIASKLLDLTEARAREKKYQSVTTKVYGVSTAMLRLLLDRSYSIIEVEKSKDEPKFNAVSLQLVLS